MELHDKTAILKSIERGYVESKNSELENNPMPRLDELIAELKEYSEHH